MKQLIYFFVFLLAASPSLAEVTFNGFASIRGGILTDGKKTDVPGMEYTDNIGFDKESLFALQAITDLGDDLSATVQMVAEGQNEYNLEAKWAYFSYNLSPNTKLKAGRLVNPIFSRSEYIDVGYSYPYARLPKAVYSVFDFNVISGVSWDGNFAMGGGDLGVKAMVGNWEGTVPVPGVGDNTVILDNLIHLSAVYSWDDFIFTLGGFQSDVSSPTLGDGAITTTLGLNTLDLDPVTAGDQLLTDPQLDAIDSVTSFDGVGRYVYAAASMDKMNILVDFEYATYGIEDSSDAQNDVYYLGVGYRFGDLTVMAHVEEYDHDGDGNVAEAAGLAEPDQTVAEGVLAQFASRIFTGNGVGLRYDFHEQAAFKLDYFNYDFDPYNHPSSPVQFARTKSSGITFGVDMMF